MEMSALLVKINKQNRKKRKRKIKKTFGTFEKSTLAWESKNEKRCPNFSTTRCE